MKKKIFSSAFLVAVVVFVSCIAIFVGLLHDYFGSLQEKQLKSELKLAQTAVEEEGLPYLKKLNRGDERLTLIASDGTVVFDSWKNAGELENHGSREEVKEAVKTGEGHSSRYSTTFTEETIYYATKLSSGDVLRIAASRLTLLSLLLAMEQGIFIIITIALILSAILAFRIAKQISEPLNQLDLEHPLENNTYDEIAPLLTKIEYGRREIAKKKKELQQKEEEFEAVTLNMNEGLVLINHRREILSINPAAKAYYDADYNVIGQNFLMLDRSPEISQLFDKTEEFGSAELLQEHKGREYQINASRIKSDKENVGIALLIFDITEKAFAERNRREFTANVSHELKTPLHSIMGSAELIEQNLVSKEDIPEFVGTIRKEAIRLLNLIDDIIRLSKLDEKAELPVEELNLKELVTEGVEPLRYSAEEKNIEIKIQGEDVICLTSKQLLREVVYNLCDNAVKYNKTGGNVVITISKEEDNGIITFEDTGIGIPDEHKARIFERFYRVDKSHSKEGGGTGLGLSIVKHGIQYLNGTITLNSVQGEGTVISITIPLKNKQ